jgi:histone deacetylase 6
MAAVLGWLSGGGAPRGEAAALEKLLQSARAGTLRLRVSLSLVASAPGVAAPLARSLTCALPDDGGACVASTGEVAALLALLAKAEPEVPLCGALEELLAASAAAATCAAQRDAAVLSRPERVAAAAAACRALERARAEAAAEDAAARAAASWRVEHMLSLADVAQRLRERASSHSFASSCSDEEEEEQERYADDGGPAFEDGRPRLSCTGSGGGAGACSLSPSSPARRCHSPLSWRGTSPLRAASPASPRRPPGRSRCGFIYDAHAAAWHAPRTSLHVVAAGGNVSPRDERPERVLAVHAALTASGALAAATHLKSRLLLPAGGSPETLRADSALLHSVHAPAYLAKLGAPFLDADGPEERWSAATALRRLPTLGMYATHSTPAAARLAAGCVVEAVERVLAGDVHTAFALVRPPGHHASCCAAAGFCWLNNAALGARAAQRAGAARVAIVDFDVHHGSGTQDVFWADGSVLYASLHRYGPGVAPGTGAAHEVGAGAGAGFTLNVPFHDAALRDEDYAAAFHWALLPVLRAFAPDIILVSAGFDAAAGDPDGGCCLSAGAFAGMARALLHVRGAHAPGGPRVVTVLEGGCHLDSLARCADAMFWAQLQFVDAAAAEEERNDEPSPPPACALRPATCDALRAVRAAHAPHWPVLAESENAFRAWAEGGSSAAEEEAQEEEEEQAYFDDDDGE